MVCLLVGLVLIVVSCIALNRPVDREGQSVHFTVSRGSSVHAIANSLASDRLIRSASFAYFYARFYNLSLKAGTFSVSSSMTTAQILRYIDAGKQEYHKATIPEGLSLSKVAQHLEYSGVVSASAFLDQARNPEILARFRIAGKDAEGFLFPDTYFFPYESDAETVVVTMLENFFAKVNKMGGIPEDPAELYAKVILASVIEREYRVADEAPLISSVFANRLRIGMGLQSCATIEYIITEIQKKPHPSRLTLEDLAISSGYNTYLWAGLPPGPISSPGLIALDAAFHPADTDYLYFRLTDPDAGTHSFTRSLDEHVEAGRHYILKKAAGN